MAKLSDFKEGAPYDAPYVEIESIMGKPFKLKDCQYFENAKGPGVHALIDLNGDELRICSHGVSVTDTLRNPELIASLKAEGPIDCKFVRVKSKTNNGREVLKIVDASEDA